MESNNDVNEVCSASKLGVTNYGVSMTTLEEVFLKLDDSSNNSNIGVSNDVERDQDLVLDDGVDQSNLTTQDGRVNMVEFDSNRRLNWYSVLWLQLTALLEVCKHI